MLIGIDAGHWKYENGKRHHKDLCTEERAEWEDNRAVAEKLETILTLNNIPWIRLDDRTGETFTTLAERYKKSNENNCTLVISIHHDAHGRANHFDETSGITVFHYPKANRKEQAERLYELLIAETGLTGNRANPIQATASLAMVRRPKAPAFLVELGFMDSAIDHELLHNDNFHMLCARAIAQFCIEEG